MCRSIEKALGRGLGWLDADGAQKLIESGLVPVWLGFAGVAGAGKVLAEVVVGDDPEVFVDPRAGGPTALLDDALVGQQCVELRGRDRGVPLFEQVCGREGVFAGARDFGSIRRIHGVNRQGSQQVRCFLLKGVTYHAQLPRLRDLEHAGCYFQCLNVGR